MKGGKNIKQFFNKIILIILMVILLIVCYLKFYCKEKVIKVCGYSFFIVITESMKPTIEPNELIIIKEFNKYKIDDIVTFLDVDNNLITHRIVQIDEYSFISKGDGNKIVDETADINNIEGKVIFHSKILGTFIRYYLKFIIVIFAIIILAICFKDRFIEVKNYEKKEE